MTSRVSTIGMHIEDWEEFRRWEGLGESKGEAGLKDGENMSGGGSSIIIPGRLRRISLGRPSIVGDSDGGVNDDRVCRWEDRECRFSSFALSSSKTEELAAVRGAKSLRLGMRYDLMDLRLTGTFFVGGGLTGRSQLRFGKPGVGGRSSIEERNCPINLEEVAVNYSINTQIITTLDPTTHPWMPSHLVAVFEVEQNAQAVLARGSCML